MSGYEALRSDAAQIDLTNRTLIRVRGEDRARLLHAMSTNNIKELSPGDGVYAFFLSAQGRILADAHICNTGDSLLLDTEPELRQKLFQHLDRYIIADDAYLEDETEQWSVLAMEGPNSLQKASAFGIPIPPKENGCVEWNAGVVARVAATGPTGLRILSAEPLSFELPHATAEEARTVRIENGIPRYGEEITERYLVQETGALHAVHFSKGCYLGQEIVERVRSRAQVHRHLRQLRIEGTEAPQPGVKLRYEGKDAAEIASAVFSPAWNAAAAFAYVRTEAAGKGMELSGGAVVL